MVKSDLKDLQLNALLEITQAINNNISEESLYKIYRFTLLANLNIEKLSLFVLEDAWDCKVNFGTKYDYSNYKLPASICSIQHIDDIELTGDLSEFESYFPVSHKNRLLAIVFLKESDQQGRNKSSKHNAFLRAVTNIILVAIENKKLARRQIEQEAYRRELEIAQRVQHFLFPKELPNDYKLTIEASYLPHQNVGGDYYDYIPLPDNNFVICIADVSGKGVPAAIIMSNFQASLRTLLRKTDDLKDIVVELNHLIHNNSNGETFITFFIGLYHSQSHELKYINCGHNPPVVFTAGRNYMMLDIGTTILGMFNPIPFINEGHVVFKDDILLFAYTDGITEALNKQGEEFGVEPLMKVINKNRNKKLVRIHEEIFRGLDIFREDTPLKDDVTMLSCKININ